MQCLLNMSKASNMQDTNRCVGLHMYSCSHRVIDARYMAEDELGYIQTLAH